MTDADPIVLISSFPPRTDSVASFCEEALAFIRKHNPDRPVVVISHAGSRGEGILPLIDTSHRKWWKPVAARIEELKPHVIHVQHDPGLYEHVDSEGASDEQRGFIELLEAIRHWPLIVEPHTIHSRMLDAEADFLYKLCHLADVVLFKCHYQKWRIEWTFPSLGRRVPANIMIVPHGARPDRRYGVHEVPQLRHDLGLDQVPNLAGHLVGLIGWIQSRRRWDILTSMWEEIGREIQQRTGQRWDLLAGGAVNEADADEYERYRGDIRQLERKGLAHYYEFTPQGDAFYKMLGVCDFIVRPSTDETQSHTLARIIALNKPFITSAPMEGLTAQTIESGGGLLFTNQQMLREAVIRLACDEGLRLRLGNQLKSYLDEVVSWDLVASTYNHVYDLARQAKQAGTLVSLPA